MDNNEIKTNVSSSSVPLNISIPDSKIVISASNNRAQYYADLAKKYRDEAKLHRDNAKYYSEHNSDVSFDYINNVKNGLEILINTKQPLGDYALKTEIPTNVSSFVNDSKYVVISELEELRLPSQENCEGKVLSTNGENPAWISVAGFNLFDIKLIDRVLDYEESKGWALQGSYVYKDTIAGSRYGYPDFYAKCLEEKEAGTATEVTLGDSVITMYINSNGHQFYDIADKDAVDTWFETYGTAWFYGIDTENERVFLPRNNYFEQLTVDVSEVGQSVKAGLPNITGIAYLGDLPNLVGGAFAYGGQIAGGAGGGGTIDHFANFNASLSSPIYGNSSTVQPNAVKKLLYICVGNTTNYEGVTEVVNQGMEILEQVNQGIESRIKLDGSNANFPYIVDTYVNGTSGYNVYSNKWCEQWGETPAVYLDAHQVITFLKPFANTDYYFNRSCLINNSTGTATGYFTGYFNKTSTSVTIQSSTYTDKTSWFASGYIA